LIVGGVATSVCTKNEVIIPENAMIGDVLVLTKPLGTQVYFDFDLNFKKNKSSLLLLRLLSMLINGLKSQTDGIVLNR